MNEHSYQKGMVQVRIQADDPYQIKRAIEAVGRDKGFVLMSRSGIRRNSGDGPRLREFASFRDLKAERKQLKDKNKKQQQ